MTAPLAYDVHTGDTEPVLAIHGISSQRRLWNWLRHSAPDITLVTPDLRGRGDSIDLDGPSSLHRHADDLIALLDDLDIDRIHVCGMSMGGFVAVDLACRYRTRVESLVLVDGGFPMATPPGLTRDMVPALFADRLGRLEQTWPSLDAYRDFFVANTTPLLDPTDPILLQYLAHDLDDQGRVRLSGAALVDDAADIYFGGDVSWEALPPDVPVRFLHAQWSTGADTPPAYPADAVERYQERTVRTRYLPGVDHAGTIMTATGAEATASLLREALDGRR